MSALDWLAMHGQGPYVWGSVLVVLLALAVESALLTLRRRRALLDRHDEDGGA